MSLIRLSRSEPAEWIVSANSTCLSFRLPCAIVRQQLGQDQQRVERRAQLVAHVGEELGLVLGGQRELLGLLLDRAARHARFRCSSLRPASSRSRAAAPSPAAPRWSLQFLLLAGEFGLPGLQLGRQQLRLLEQALGAHGRGDRVQHDADRFRQLVEEALVGLVELAERGELDHRLDLVLRTERAGRTMFAGGASPRPEPIRMKSRRNVVQQDRPASRPRTARRGPRAARIRCFSCSWFSAP